MNPHHSLAPRRLALSLLAAAALAGALGGCIPLVVGGAVGTAMVASDRRTSGAQLEDEGIELRSVNRIRDNMGDSAHINVTSYNRLVLLTGEVASAQAKQQLSDLIAKVDNARSVVNETAVDVPSSLGQRSADTLTTGRVKAALVDTRNIQSRAFKVVTERGVVYLMGIVTQREADLAAEVARNVSSV
ncbi:MAG: BON domain-containing protein [Burkholderiales bacterium]